MLVKIINSDRKVIKLFSLKGICQELEKSSVIVAYTTNG